MKRRTPDFLIIGAPKCGTTSLAATLNNHPDVYIPPIKEVGFFMSEKNWKKGVDWYVSYFEDTSGGEEVGEATPYYLQSPEAPVRIAEVCPKARLIAIVRDPVERARSHYWYRRRHGKEPREVQEAFEAEIARYPDMKEEDYLIPSGLYARQLERYVDIFGRDQIHVLTLHRLTSSPGLALRRLQNHIRIEPRSLPLAQKNQSSAPWSRRYRDFVQELVKSQGLLKRLIKAITTRTTRRKIMEIMHAVNMKKKEKPKLPVWIRRSLKDIYSNEVKILEREFGMKFRRDRDS